MWLTVPDRFVQFLDPCLNRSGEIRPKAVGGASVRTGYDDKYYSRSYRFVERQKSYCGGEGGVGVNAICSQPEVADDVISNWDFSSFRENRYQPFM